MLELMGFTNNSIVFKEAPVDPPWATLEPEATPCDQLTREKEEMTILQELAAKINGAVEMDEIVWTLYDGIGPLIDTTNFAVALYNNQTDTLHVKLMFDQGRRIKPFTIRQATRHNLIGQVLSDRMPLNIPDLHHRRPNRSATSRSDTRLLSLATLPENSNNNNDDETSDTARAWLGVPIINADLSPQSVQGVLMTWSHQPHIFEDHHLDLLTAISRHAANALRNARMFAACQRRADELAMFKEVAHTLTAVHHLDEVLVAIMAQVERMLDVELGALLLTDPETGELVYQMGLGDKAPVGEPFRLAKGQGIAGRVVQSGKPVALGRMSRRTRNILCVPLKLREQIIGVLEVRNKKEGDFNGHDLMLLTSLASHAAIAIGNAQLYESVLAERDRVYEAEEQARRKLARDLHDGPTQLVGGIAMRLEFCQNALLRQPELVGPELVELKDEAERVAHQLRTMLFELRPLVLETDGLVAAIRALFESRRKTARTTKLTLDLDSRRPDGALSRPDEQVEAALFAIIQETVTNALKHAQATEINVTLQETATDFVAIITDDGQGFDPNRVIETHQEEVHLGMVNIRERAELIGGELTLKTAPGHGTRITVRVSKSQAERTKKRHTTGSLQVSR